MQEGRSVASTQIVCVDREIRMRILLSLFLLVSVLLTSFGCTTTAPASLQDEQYHNFPYNINAG